MIISEKQIMKLIMIAQGYIKDLNASEDMIKIMIAKKLGQFLYEITNQQSEELKVIE